MNDSSPPRVERTQASVRRSSWPGWIWAVPIAAILLVGWWGLRDLMSGGEDVTITFSDVHGLKGGDTSVEYRGMTVGKANGMTLANDGKTVQVAVHIQSSATQFLRSGTRFWLRGAHPSLSDLASLSAVMSGPTIMMDPGPGAKTTEFVGLEREPVLGEASGPAQLYRVAMKGSVGGLKEGEAVKLRGFTVGEVHAVGFRFDPGTGEIATPVTLALYPALFHVDAAKTAGPNAAAGSAIATLVREGLQARLERDPPLVGEPQVTLDVISDAKPDHPPGELDGLPQIPAAADSGIESVVGRINKLPVEQIGQNVLDITHHLETVVASPKLEDAVAQLDASLKEIHATAQAAGPKISSLADSLRETAARLDQVAQSADRMLGGTPVQNGAPQMMREVTEAARSVRELANYLDRHPEALVKGRSGD